MIRVEMEKKFQNIYIYMYVCIYYQSMIQKQY